MGKPGFLKKESSTGPLLTCAKHQEVRDVIPVRRRPPAAAGSSLGADSQILVQSPFGSDPDRYAGAWQPAERITPKLCEIIKIIIRLYMNLHFNHPDELTRRSNAPAACWPMPGFPGAQTVLLKA